MPNILAVDDLKSMRHMISLTLGDAGHNVYKATDTHEGLLKAAYLGPDVILADIDMPTTGGIELVKNIRALPHMSEVPILLLSSETRASSAEKIAAQAAGATGWLCKSISPQKLLQTVEAVLR